MGMYFCEGMDDSPAMVRLHAKHTEMSFKVLVDIFKIRDWELMARATVWIMAGFVLLRLGDGTRAYIRKCCEALNTEKLQFIPTCGQPPEFSEDLHEKFSVLSQIIYFENFLFLVCGGAKPTMTAGIENEFRHQLRVRPAISLSFRSRVHRPPVESVSGTVQDLSVDHAHANNFAGQRRGAHTRPSSD